MLSANFRLCFGVLLAVFCHVQGSLHNNDTLASLGFSDWIRCNWNCTVVESDLTEELKTTIIKRKLIRIVVKYETKVEGNCVNHTFRNSSGNITEQWQIWLENKQLSTFAKAVESVANLMFYTDSNEERKEIRAMCTLEPVKTTATRSTYYSGSSPIFFRGHLADLGVEFNGIDCNTEETDNLQPCINITTATGNNTKTSAKVPRGGWPVNVFGYLCLVFLAVFIYYSPAFLCLFSPTEVTEDGVCQIVLEGVSPVSLRSLMGNYFFSKDDTIWHRARMFFLRAVVFPFPFLGPAIFVDYLQQQNVFRIPNILGVSHLFQTRMLVYCGCYYILTFYISFFTKRAKRPCFICKRVKSKTLICQDVLPKQIINHLRIQPLILVKCWKIFTQYLVNYFKMSFLVFPSGCRVSAMFFARLSLFIVVLSAIPAVTLILLTAALLVAGSSILGTCPVIIVCSKPVHVYSCNCYFKFIFIMIVTTTCLGALFVLMLAGIGVLTAIVLIFLLLLSEESLPFVTCVVLVFYYIWSSYSSFTNKYEDLALALFTQYKKSRHDNCKCEAMPMALNTDQGQENKTDNKENVMKIPKELFHLACEELMPVREGVCILFLKVTIIVSFVLLVFTITMLSNVGATPVMKALFTFLTGAFPKIVAIYIDGGRQKKIEAMITDEKIPKILQEYNNRASGSNQGQENCSLDVNEAISLNVDTENIELLVNSNA